MTRKNTTLLDLAKSFELESVDSLFNYAVSVHVNGNFSSYKDLVQDICLAGGKAEYYDYLVGLGNQPELVKALALTA